MHRIQSVGESHPTISSGRGFSGAPARDVDAHVARGGLEQRRQLGHRDERDDDQLRRARERRRRQSCQVKQQRTQVDLLTRRRRASPRTAVHGNSAAKVTATTAAVPSALLTMSHDKGPRPRRDRGIDGVHASCCR
jgi:hypothetical protein